MRRVKGGDWGVLAAGRHPMHTLRPRYTKPTRDQLPIRAVPAHTLQEMSTITIIIPRMHLSHICGVCGKGFAALYRLTRHARTHSEERPFACGQCSRRFRRSDHLKKHTQLHAKTTAQVYTPIYTTAER